MTSLSTVSAGIKPPTSIPPDTSWLHDGDLNELANGTGAEKIDCSGGGVAVEELNVTGSGYLQLLCAGNRAGQTDSINLTLTLDGVELYNYTQGNGSVRGPIAAGMVHWPTASDGRVLSLDAYRFEEGFTVDITTSATQCKLVYKYYLDS